MQDTDLVTRASGFHPWDAMTPMALSAILKRGPFRSTAETGCGGSTIVLSHASDRHTAFAIDGKDRTITELRKQSDLRTEKVTFVEGETKDTLPQYQFEGELDLVLLDGPHAYPLPQIEFSYLFPWIRLGGWLVVDDFCNRWQGPNHYRAAQAERSSHRESDLRRGRDEGYSAPIPDRKSTRLNSSHLV